MTFAGDDKVIDLELTNNDGSNSTNVNLFELPASFSGGSGSLYTYKLSVTPTDALKNTFGTLYITDGTTATIVTSSVSITNTQLADFLITATGIQWEVIGSDIVAAVSTIIYTSLYRVGETTIPTNIITNLATNISGSTASVTLDEDINYSELVSELNNGNYILEWYSIYSNSISQSIQHVKINETKPNSFKNLRYQNPTIAPYTKQFVTEKNPLMYYVIPTSKLTYKLLAGETVRIIFKYKTLIAEPLKSEFYETIPKLNKPIDKVIDIDVPMLRPTALDKIMPQRKNKMIKEFLGKVENTGFKPLTKLDVSLDPRLKEAKDYAIRKYIDDTFKK